MKILKRDYDVAANKIKGIEKLENECMEDAHKGKLSRFIVVLDETGYKINDDGEPEMTEDTKKAALALLKGEKTQTSGILSSILGDSDLLNNLSNIIPGANLFKDMPE